MTVYGEFVALLNFCVDWLLLLATNCLAGYSMDAKRSAWGAAVGGVYAYAAMYNGLSILSGAFGQIICLIGICMAAFGIRRSAISRGVLFLLLSMALGGIAMSLHNGGYLSLLLSAGVLLGLCVIGFRGRTAGERYASVEIRMKNSCCRLTALLDTGNTLLDPLTGQRVLVVGAQAAFGLLGIAPEELADPISTLAKGRYPGLRLIPYRSVGRANGILLAVQADSVRINGKEAQYLVAFAPEGLDDRETYQALAGGAV